LKELEAEAEASRSGVVLPAGVCGSLKIIADELGISFPSALSNVRVDPAL